MENNAGLSKMQILLSFMKKADKGVISLDEIIVPGIEPIPEGDGAEYKITNAEDLRELIEDGKVIPNYVAVTRKNPDGTETYVAVSRDSSEDVECTKSSPTKPCLTCEYDRPDENKCIAAELLY